MQTYFLCSTIKYPCPSMSLQRHFLCITIEIPSPSVIMQEYFCGIFGTPSMSHHHNPCTKKSSAEILLVLIKYFVSVATQQVRIFSIYFISNIIEVLCKHIKYYHQVVDKSNILFPCQSYSNHEYPWFWNS